MPESAYEGARRMSDDSQSEFKVQYKPTDDADWRTYHVGNKLSVASLIHAQLTKAFDTRLLVDGNQIA
jgi:hypothetical protein